MMPAGLVLVGHAPVLVPVVDVKKKEKKKEKNKKKKEGYWETMREANGDTYWKHTGSKEIRDIDPYL